MSSITLDKRVEKSIDRLKAMGLKCHIEVVGKDEAYIVIDMDSLMNMIYRKITYPNKKIYIEGKYMIIKSVSYTHLTLPTKA